MQTPPERETDRDRGGEKRGIWEMSVEHSCDVFLLSNGLSHDACFSPQARTVSLHSATQPSQQTFLFLSGSPSPSFLPHPIQNHVFPFGLFPLSLFNFSVDGNAVWRRFGVAADSVLDVPPHRNEFQLYLEEIFPEEEDWDFSWIITL